MSIQKTEIQLQVNDRKVNAYLAAPQAGGPGILVLHAWWGLKPFFKQVCDHLAEQGFVALAPDLRNGEVAQTIEAATELMKKSDAQFVSAVILAAEDYLLTSPLKKGPKIGILGFSMGGAWSLYEANRAPDQFAAAVVFYGSHESDYAGMQAKFLGHFCEVDDWEPLEDVRKMEAAMQAASVDATFQIYPGVSHWFVEEDRPEYDPTATKLAWERTYNFFKTNL